MKPDVRPKSCSSVAEALDAYRDVQRSHAGLKRFFERWTADPGFKKELEVAPDRALASSNIRIDVADIAWLLDRDVPESSASPPPPVRTMWEIAMSKMRWVRRFYHEEAVPDAAGIRAWRNRQLARQRFDLGPFHADSNIHSSLAVELTDGCSVGCWFCALDPTSLRRTFLDTDDNRRLWDALLANLGRVLGSGLRSGFLYWATDPFDNPDYEAFCLDFHAKTGVFPPTTTALAMRDPARTRRLLAMSEERGCWLNRFSLPTLSLMRQVHREFDAEELAQVECLPLNPQANLAYGNAGRFRRRALENPRLLAEQDRKLRRSPWHASDPQYRDSSDYANGSIGCVTGFLVNLCRREVRLASPCTASPDWPLGSIVFSRERFSDEDDLGNAISRIADRHFRAGLRSSETVRFQDYVSTNPTPQGFVVTGRFRQQRLIERPDMPAAIQLVGRLIEDGRWSAEEIADQVANEHRLVPATIRALLDEIFEEGLIHERPLP